MPYIRPPVSNQADYVGNALRRRQLRQRSVNPYLSQMQAQPEAQQESPLGGIAQNMALSKLTSGGVGASSVGTGGGAQAGGSALGSLGGAALPAAIIGAALVARNQIEKSKYFRGRGPLGKLGEASRTADPFSGYNIAQAPKEALRRPAHYLNEQLNPLAQSQRLVRSFKSLFK